jgi:hypothetical protein
MLALDFSPALFSVCAPPASFHVVPFYAGTPTTSRSGLSACRYRPRTSSTASSTPPSSKHGIQSRSRPQLVSIRCSDVELRQRRDISIGCVTNDTPSATNCGKPECENAGSHSAWAHGLERFQELEQIGFLFRSQPEREMLVIMFNHVA